MLRSIISQINLPKSLLEMSNTTIQENLAVNWSGAVCVICVDNSILYIKRSETMPTHKGQVAFIGGHKDKVDITPIDTARRELSEELGVGHEHFNLEGLLPPVKTSSKHVIMPVVFDSKLSKEELFKRISHNTEWSNLFLIPIEDLCSHTSWSYAIRTKRLGATSLLFCALKLYDDAVFFETEKKNLTLWGATARMTWSLLKIATKQGINVTP